MCLLDKGISIHAALLWVLWAIRHDPHKKSGLCKATGLSQLPNEWRVFMSECWQCLVKRQSQHCHVSQAHKEGVTINYLYSVIISSRGHPFPIRAKAETPNCFCVTLKWGKQTVFWLLSFNPIQYNKPKSIKCFTEFTACRTQHCTQDTTPSHTKCV